MSFDVKGLCYELCDPGVSFPKDSGLTDSKGADSARGASGDTYRIVVDTLSVESGQLTAIIGPNGAGKSTLLRLLTGLLKPLSGEIRVAGMHTPYDQLYQHISYLPQHLETHWPLSVASVVALGEFNALSSVGRNESAWKRLIDPALSPGAAVEAILSRLDLQALRERPVTELSGGELTRVMLGRALVRRAPFLLVDEPVNHLDPAHQLAMMRLLRDEADLGRGVLAVLHDFRLVAKFCDHVIVMDCGEIVSRGAPGEVITDALLGDVFGIAQEDRQFWLAGL